MAKLTRFLKGTFVVTFLAWTLSASAKTAHPNLVITADDVPKMRQAIKTPGRFQQAFNELKKRVDASLDEPLKVPVPKDGGGGYTHEQHKANYQQMYDAGILYQLTQEKRYAEQVQDLLLAYAKLYPTLELHPQRKENAQNPGKLFWQSLNEAVWLVYTIQAYDLVYEAISANNREQIETKLLKPVAKFLSEGQPSTFNKVHNHGTWATAGVGMAGYVLGHSEWVEQALYDLDKSGQGGFLAQLDQLFSPQGYYTEGPYYQRYALLPFITFAKAIQHNEPQRDIFAYRDNILLKAIDTTIQLSYDGLFFPLNDAIKSKGIDTIELVRGVTVAYGQTGDPEYLDIAREQGQIILSGDGLKVAQALDAGKGKPYEFDSVAFGDGSDGKQGALVIMRSKVDGDQALLFKPAAQGMGHGHFDKLTWQFYDQGAEIVSDYGAARFLNVEAKFGGRYLPENNSYAKQTVAHNTVVVDETSHFDGDVKLGNQHAPELAFFAHNQYGSVAKATIETAYSDTTLTRTMALVNLDEQNNTLVLDFFAVNSEQARQFDLPLHYQGQLIETSFPLSGFTSELRALGQKNGYQHLWLKGKAQPEEGLARVTWLNDNGRFYTHTSVVNGQENFLFTQVGAGDPNFNLRNEQGFIRRVNTARSHQFLSILEAHGEYNPAQEFTRNAQSQVSSAQFISQDNQNLQLVHLTVAGREYLIAIAQGSDIPTQFNFDNQSYSLTDRLAVFTLRQQEN